MIKKLSFSIFLLLILVFSAGAIQASDVNATDVATLELNDDVSLELEEVLDESPLQDGEKNQTQLTSPTTTIYYNGNYEATLTDSANNQSLANKDVKFSINKVEYSAKTNDNGVAGVNLKLNPGDYVATSYFAGDSDFKASNNLSASFKVLSTINAKDITKYYKGSTAYQATFLDSQGNPLKNTKVTLTVSGKSYTKTTNANGVASMAINFKPGTYKVTAANPVTGEKLTTDFKVLSTVTASDLKKVKGDSRKFTAKFFKSNGQALVKQQVKVKINGKTYKYKTDSNGQLKLAFNSFKKGTYKVICYNKDGLSRTNTVQIFNIATTKITANSYVFLENDNKEIKIKFSTSLNDNSKAGKKIRIYVDWDPYYRTTDSNGEITLKLPYLEPGCYQIDCEYDGDKFYRYSYKTVYVSILENSETNLTVESESLSFGNLAGTPLQVAYTSDEIPLVGKTVCFSVNGKNYNVTTDYGGIASFPINLDTGKYTVNYRTFDDGKVKGSSGSCNITVFKRADTKINCKFGSTVKDSAYTLKIQLTDANGNPVKYAEVEFSMDGDSYSEETDSKGYATFYARISLGKYKVSFKFKGDEKRAASSTSKTINVVISKYKNGINEKKASASSAYLKGTKNAPTNNAKIKKLVKSLTKGKTTVVDKARAIFRYVRDNVRYDYYYGTKKGAVGTLNSKKANCVDQSHLLVSMFRTAGIKTRYVQGICTYSDGTFYHFWTQILIDGKWVCADPVNSVNELGQINDWNTKTFKLKGKYVNIA